MTDHADHALRLKALNDLRSRIGSIARVDRDIAGALTGVEAALEKVIETLLRKPDSWRVCRALHVVHIPSLHTALGLYLNLDERTGRAERDAILAAFSRSAALFEDARTRLADQARLELLIEIETLADRAPPAAPVPARGLAGRLWGSVEKMGADAGSAIAGYAGDVLTDVGQRSAAIARLGAGLGGSAGALIRENLTGPIAVRIGASGRAIEAGVSGGLGLGLVIGILCPPLLPLAAAGGVVDALEAYNKGVERLGAIEAEEQEARRAELRADRLAALRQVAGGAGSLQIETDTLSLTVDADTGQADAVILSGDMAGRSWSQLSARERDTVMRRNEGTSSASILDILSLALVA